MDIFGVQDSAGVSLHQNGRFCSDGRTGGPARKIVGLNRQKEALLRSLLGFVQRFIWFCENRKRSLHQDRYRQHNGRDISEKLFFLL